MSDHQFRECFLVDQWFLREEIGGGKCGGFRTIVCEYTLFFWKSEVKGTYNNCSTALQLKVCFVFPGFYTRICG